VLARTRLHSRQAERFVDAFSRQGEYGAVWIVLGCAGAVLARDASRRRTWRRGAVTVAGAWAANYALKLAVGRGRPEIPGWPPLTPTASNLSFPSAHATTSFAAAWAYSPVAPRGKLYAVAIAFALSRPYLGVHYPSDALAGALLGTGLAWVTQRIGGGAPAATGARA
jgi:membrane-associated phospholipid phosphatase